MEALGLGTHRHGRSCGGGRRGALATKAEATGRDEGLVVTVATEVVVSGGLLAEHEGPAPGAAEPEVLVRCVV
jgi:hypothetical protein